MQYNLGDEVEYTQISIKTRSANKVVRLDIKLPNPKHGVITGYRNMPIGIIEHNQEDGNSLRQTGTVGCYLVTFDLHKNADQVQEEFISPYTPTENTSTIMSPYEDTLIKVLKTIRYEKYGYIYRVEKIMFSLDEPDEVMEMKVCYTLDGQYLGDNKTASFLCRTKGIREFVKTDEIRYPVCVGFNPKEQNWYGWSHRAIYGFGIGSTIKKGDCGYKPKDKYDMFSELCSWYEIDQVQDLGDKLGTCINKLVTYRYDDKHREKYYVESPIDISSNKSSNKPSPNKSDIEYGPEEVGLTMIVRTEFSNGRDSITNEHFNAYPVEWGKGEWTAKTLEDAKQMAADFAEGVS